MDAKVGAIWRAVEWCLQQKVAPLHIVPLDLEVEGPERWEEQARRHDGKDEHDSGASLHELRRL